MAENVPPQSNGDTEKQASDPTINLNLDSKDLAEKYDIISTSQHKAGLSLIQKLSISPSDKILDIGCGTGSLTAHVATLLGPTGHIIGIDPLPLRIEVARKRIHPNLSFEVADAHDLSKFAPESFDIVYLNSVFHWLTDQAGALRQILRVLKKGGRIGIQTSSGDQPWPMLDIKSSVLSSLRQRNPQKQDSRIFSICKNPLESLSKAISQIKPIIKILRGNTSPKPPLHYTRASNTDPYFLTWKGLQTLLHTTGFLINQISLDSSILSFETSQAVIEFLESSMFGNYLLSLPEDIQGPAREEIIRRFETELKLEDGRIGFVAGRTFAIASKGIIVSHYR